MTLCDEPISPYKAPVSVTLIHIVTRLSGRLMLVTLAVLLALPAPSAGAMAVPQMKHERIMSAAIFVAAQKSDPACATDTADHNMTHCDMSAQRGHDEECCADDCDGCVCTSCLTHLSGLMIASAGSMDHDSASKLSIFDRVVETRVTQVPKSPPKHHS